MVLPGISRVWAIAIGKTGRSPVLILGLFSLVWGSNWGNFGVDYWNSHITLERLRCTPKTSLERLLKALFK